jgi:antiviral helicase SKI2
MILGKSTKLESQFRLTYNMILNLFKMGGEFKVEDMIKRSFFEANNQKLLSKHKERLRQGEVKLIDLEEIVCSVHSDQKPAPVWDYLHNKLEEQRLSVAIQKYLMNSPQGRQFLEAGRVVVVNGGEVRNNAQTSWK